MLQYTMSNTRTKIKAFIQGYVTEEQVKVTNTPIPTQTTVYKYLHLSLCIIFNFNIVIYISMYIVQT